MTVVLMIIQIVLVLYILGVVSMFGYYITMHVIFGTEERKAGGLEFWKNVAIMSLVWPFIFIEAMQEDI